MKKILMRSIISVTMLTICISGFGQNFVTTPEAISELVDSLKKAGLIHDQVQVPDKPTIELTTNQAVEFLERYYRPRFWHDVNDPLRKAIEHLVFLTTRPSYSSSEAFLKNYEFDSIKIPWESFYVWDTLKFKIPDTEPVSFHTVDTMRFETDTINFAAEMDRLRDTSIVIIADKLQEVVSSEPHLPFRYYNNVYQIDSLEVAVKSLINYLNNRGDSTIINFAGRGNEVVPIWFNSQSNNTIRYWLKNEFNDSVTVWIGNTGRDTIGLFVEQGVNFRRNVRPTTNNTEARVNVERQDRTRLLELQTLEVKKQLWKYKTETNLKFDQTGMFNWVKGGESNLASLLNVRVNADFDDTDKKLSSKNFIRLNLGYIKTGENPLRKSSDILETDSKLNHKAFGKFDFSGVMLLKTQLMKGYNYKNPDDPYISKILNPLNMTLGFGLDYKPNAQTSINFSPLAYKLTYVSDTVNIDQTRYGVDKNQKAKHEPGINFQITNTMRPFKDVSKPYQDISMTNRLVLFTNYIHKPQNVDIDWELTLTTKLNWFTELRVNTHLIFSDNVKTAVLDKDKKPILNDDGTEKRSARIQFKEVIGLSLAFVF